MKKILVVIGRADKGIGKRLELMFDRFPKNKYSISIVCLNNYIGINTPLEYKSYNYPVKDLKSYNTFSLKKAILKEMPDALVIIAARHMIERITMIVGRNENIPVIFIQHGMLYNSYTTDGQSVVSKDKLILSRSNLKKYLVYFFVYIKSILLGYPFTKTFFQGLRYLLTFPFKLKMSVRYYQLDSEKPSYALLYSDYDKDFFCKRGYGLDQIEVLGFPEQISQNLSENLFSLQKHRPIILYIGGLVLAKEYNWTEKVEAKFLELMNKIAQENNFTFIYKAHPAQDIQEYEKHYRSNYFLFIEDVDINQLIEISDLVISQMSTGLCYAISRYKPIIIPKVDKNYIYTVDYSKFGIGRVCDFNDIEIVLKDFKNKAIVNKENYDKFIEYNIGKVNSNYSKDILNFINRIL